ncbi:hypothetical protein CPB85DRAFT_193781 [Mucidula mucida]|nr:hypothetical protein CPB85DRAFT_193781 [Mucidula mucida]
MASRILWLGFNEVKEEIKFRPLKDRYLEGEFTAMFEPFPFPSSDPEPLLEVPFKARMNDTEGKPREYSLDQALSWGYGLDSESSLSFPAYYVDGEGQQTLFCLKVVFNTEKVEPDHYCKQAIRRLLADANFYGHHLRDVAGTLVPRHYGVWRAKTGEWGGTVLCSVTEWGGVTWDTVAAKKRDTTMVKKAIGRTIERLHNHSIHHNQLHHASQVHHLLVRFDKTDAGTITRCFVVDFSKAAKVPCARNLPILPIDADVYDGPEGKGCEEARSVTYLLDMSEPEVDMSPSSNMCRAIRFCERYSAQHPSLDNAAVMVVQRHHFFSDEPPLEPDITFGFRPDGKVVFNVEDSDSVVKRLPEVYVQSLVS